MNSNKTLDTYNRLKNIPFGKKIFMELICRTLPYFRSIKPTVLELEPGKSIVQMKERRSVHNHLNTVHAIALCNLCELAMALLASATIPNKLRFIPSGMTVSYKKKAKGILTAKSTVAPEKFRPGNLDIPVNVFNESGENVMSAIITLNIKEKAT